MRILILVLIYLFMTTATALAHPRLYPRNPEMETVTGNPAVSSFPLKKDGSYNAKYRAKRSTMHIKKRVDDDEDVSDDFQRDFRMGYDASGDMQAHYGYFSKRDNGFPFKDDHELKRKHLQERNAFHSHESRKRVQFRSKRSEEKEDERKAGHSKMVDHEKDCCNGYTEKGLINERDCECHAVAGEDWRDGLLTDLDEDRCAEKIYNDYRKKNPSQKYIPTATTEENDEAAQADCSDCEENELQLQKTYEDYYQGLQSECFQRKRRDNTESWETNIFETEEGQVHEKDGPVVDSEDSIYESGEGQLHETNNYNYESEEDMDSDIDSDIEDTNGHIEDSSIDGTLDSESSTKQKETIPVTFLEFVCTTNRLSPLSVDVFRIAEYFNNDGLNRICRVAPLQVNRCTRIGGIRSASIGVCDHYFGWQAVCGDVGKQIFELIRRCEELIDGHYKVSGKIFRQGWGGNVIVYRLV
ncbi:hypothetical protein P167DRAFT_578013 [Morchella conica CCBAS932]|uniref:Cyanovirin-N domain-containing protein n=1 Tax=Morchella conica CCBAS932 TaxID=1392247 RepID=A0A3N4KDR9_9PEZI|nr:hypothetical protein P167DRAFT_578013 [Morchella conica CCBAS932]